MTIETRRNLNGNNNSIGLGKLIEANRVEIIKDRLYFETIDGIPVCDAHNYYFRTDDDEFHYESFYEDFGPLNLAMLYRYCCRLQRKLRMLNLSKKRIVHYASSNDQKQRVNSAYLIGSFAIIYLHKSAEELWRLFENCSPFLPFRDAALGPSTYDLTLRDVFAGVEKAAKHKWLNFNEDVFNVDEYEYYEKVENGDFNWIIPGKILAFCGPHNKAGVENGYPHHSPETYFPYFRKYNVTTIVRLNKKLYDARRFIAAGFQHVDLFFIDGSCPSEQIVRHFIAVVEQAPGAVAIHCKAGLGRTGTLIACWMMKKFRVTAPECIAWARICRPGSVIGPQQEFLIEKQEWCWEMNALPSASLSEIIASPGSTQKSSEPASLNGLVSQVDDIKISGPSCQAPADTEVSATVSLPSNSTAATVLINPQRRTPSPAPAPTTEPSSGAAMESDTYSQGDQLMRIKATRGSGRNQAAQVPKKSGGTGSKVVNAFAAGVAKRILPSRARRTSSLKDSTKTARKGGSSSELVTTSTIGSSGPARKAAKHQAGADASSSIGSSGTSTDLIRVPKDVQFERAIVQPSSYYSQQRNGRPTTVAGRLTSTTTTSSSVTKMSDGTAQIKRRVASKSSSSFIPHPIAASSTPSRLDSSKNKKTSGVASGSTIAARSVPRSTSVVVATASSAIQKSAIAKPGTSAKASPYFLRRRSISNMQTMLMPSAPTAIASRNAAAVISSAFAPDHVGFMSNLPQPASSSSVMSSAYPRRATSTVYKSGKTKRVTS